MIKINKSNNPGPMIEPCGRPEDTEDGGEVESPTQTLRERYGVESDEECVERI